MFYADLCRQAKFFIYFCMSIFECYDTGNTIKRKRQTFISAFGASSNGSGVDEQRKDILSLLLSSIVTAFIPEGWTLDSVTLIQDQETFEKFEFTSMDKKWTRYVKMNR